MYAMLLNLGCIIHKYLQSCADCNYTIGISVIDNFVGYIQESIDSFRVPASILLSVVVLSSGNLSDRCTNFQDEPVQLTFIPNQVSRVCT